MDRDAELRDAHRRLRELNAELQSFSTKLALQMETDWERRYVLEGIRDLEQLS